MKDMSETVTWQKGLNAGESMANGNTIRYDKDATAMQAPGSQPVYDLPDQLDHPDLDISPLSQPTTLVNGNKVPGNGGWADAFVAANNWKKAGS